MPADAGHRLRTMPAPLPWSLFYQKRGSTVARDAGANAYELGEWRRANVHPDYHGLSLRSVVRAIRCHFG
jgi:hypothetical protein